MEKIGSLSLEEGTTGPVKPAKEETKSKEIPKLDATGWKVEGIYLAGVMELCLKYPGPVVYLLANENVPCGFSDFQNHISNDLIQDIDPRYKTKRADILPKNSTQLEKMFANLLKNMTPLVNELVGYYKDKLSEFKVARFWFVQNLLNECALATDASSTASKSTQSTSSSSSVADPMSVRITETVTFPNITVITHIMNVGLKLHEYCEKFRNEIAGKLLGKKNPDEESVRALLRCADFWKTYAAAFVEMEAKLAPLAQAMNEATDKLFLGVKGLPSFKMYNIFKAVFIRDLYQPLKFPLLDALRSLIEKTSRRRLYYVAMQTLSGFATYNEKQLADFLKGESLDNLTESKIIDDAEAVNSVTQLFVDLFANELNILYIHNSDLATTTNGFLTWMRLRAEVTNAFTHIIEMIKGNPKLLEVKIEIMVELLKFYDCVFPPTLLTEVRQAFKEELKGAKDNKISELIDKIKSGQKLTAVKGPSSKEPDDLFEKIKNLLTKKGEAATESIVDKYLAQIKDEPSYRSLCDFSEEFERQNTDTEVNDLATNRKYKDVGIPFDAERNDCYNAYGMSPDTLKKLFPNL